MLVTWGVWLRPRSRNLDRLIPKWAAALPFGNIGIALFVLLSTPAPGDSHASRWFATIAIVLTAILGSATFFEYGRLLRMETLAMTDVLTGLRNRRYAFDILTAMLSMRPRNVQYAILVIDLDDLKMINDDLGHAAGDSALKLVANAVGSVTRPSDLCARIGGDEFVLALTMVDVSESRVRAAAMETMERLRDRLRDETIGGRTVEFSVGLAICPGDGESLDHLVQQADEAMYQDKRTRRANGR
jgi:diguanylate cyclase (GGDEF)-like protein